MNLNLYYIYDLECYPEFFSCSLTHYESGERWRFEISKWVNQSRALYSALRYLQSQNSLMVGFNNVGYDYPMLHFIMQLNGTVDHEQLYHKSCSLIDSKWGNNSGTIWPDNRFIRQVDLMKIHHFDNGAKLTSLKMLEYNMQSPDIKDLPYPPGTYLTRLQADNVLKYNDHDTDETKKFFVYSLPQIKFRHDLSIKKNNDFFNHNDTKIGESMITEKLIEAKIPIKAHGKVIQSRRDSVICKDVMLPYLNFETKELNDIKDFFERSTLDKKDKKGLLEVKGFFKDVTCEIDGLVFKFGAGGIHASRNREIFEASETHDLVDWDVASYYPNLAIVNNFFPEHLTELFCQIYLTIYQERSKFTKAEIENAIYKLALNAVFGNSNAEFSVFHDPKYLLSITINGQLLLCMLAEQLMKIPGLKMIQLNTDGLTFLCPKEHHAHANKLWKWWEDLTKLTLEEAVYSKMAIRDVNNYIAQKTDGHVKRIGCYAHVSAADRPSTRELAWHKDFSSRVVAKAAEAALIHGTNIEEFIRNHPIDHDFTLRTKVPKLSYLLMCKTEYWGTTKLGVSETKLQNIIRFYPTLTGGNLVKVMPPTIKEKNAWYAGDHYKHEDTHAYVVKRPGVKPPSGKYKLVVNPNLVKPDKRERILSGQLVTDCSNMNDFDRENIDYEYFIKETRKIVDPLFSNQM